MNTNTGSVNIFVHGIMQNRFFFEKTIDMLNNASEKKDVIDIGVITFRQKEDGTVSKRVNSPFFSCTLEFTIETLKGLLNKEFKKMQEPVFLPSKEFLKLTASMSDQTLKSKLKRLTKQGNNLGLRYEGSKIFDSTLNMRKELRKVVRTIIPNDTNCNLIGHSRGGLACLSYAMTYPDTVNKVITLGTPYAGNAFAKYLGNNSLVKALVKSERMSILELANETPFLKNLQEEWNRDGKEKIDLTAIGFSFGIGADGLVDIRSQLAVYKGDDMEYKNVKRIQINSKYKNAAHSNEATNPTLIKLLNTMIRQEKTLTRVDKQEDDRFKKLLDRIGNKSIPSVDDISEKVLRPRRIFC